MSIFHTNIRSSAKNLSQLKCYLGALEFNFSIIGISENWGTRENINVQTIILTPHLLNQILKMTRKCQYFIPTLEALLKI